MKRMYLVGVGVDGVALEHHKVEAQNQSEARSIVIRKYLHPDKGFNHIEIKHIKKDGKTR